MHSPDTTHIFYVHGQGSYWASVQRGDAHAPTSSSPLQRLQEVAVALNTMRDYEHPFRKITQCLIQESCFDADSLSTCTADGECHPCVMCDV